MQKNILGLAVTIVVFSFVSACSQQDEVQHDVSYYKEHDNDRIVKLKECRDDPGHLALDSNCMNAAKADQKKESEATGLVKEPDYSGIEM